MKTRHFPLACLCAALVAAWLSGCAGLEISDSYVRNPLPEAAMVTAIAEDAAGKLATIYPPGLTRIEVIYPAGDKGQRREDAFSITLEDGLRRRGFTIAPSTSLRLAWTLDAVPETVPETNAAAAARQGQEKMVWWYLRLQITDADKFATRTLTRMYGANGAPLAGFAEQATGDR